MKCTVCKGPAVIDVRRHNANFCADHFLKLVPRPGGEGDQGLRHAHARRPGARRGVGRQGLAGRVGHPARARVCRRRAVPGAGDRRLQRRVGGDGALVRVVARPATDRGRPAHGSRLRHPDGSQGGPARAVLRVRALQAPPVRRGRPYRRLRRRRDGPQPRRRGRGALRQRAALADRLPGPAAAGAPGPPRLPTQGQAPGPPRRAGDGGVLRAPWHRLHRRGVPDGRWQQAPRLQGGAQRHRGDVAGHEARLLLRVPRPGVRSVHLRCGDRAEQPRRLLPVRSADHGRGVRVLPPRRAGDRDPGRARSQGRSAR